ncbi:MAG: hypothetical protein ACI4UF_03860 [Thermoguttaceae bacterium]
MSQEEERKIKAIILRLPTDLYEKVKNKAAASGLSVTQFIIFTLKNAKTPQTTEERLDSIEERLAKLDSLDVRLARVEMLSRMLPGVQRNIFLLKKRVAGLELAGQWNVEEDEYTENPEDMEKEQD